MTSKEFKQRLVITHEKAELERTKLNEAIIREFQKIASEFGLEKGDRVYAKEFDTDHHPMHHLEYVGVTTEGLRFKMVGKPWMVTILDSVGTISSSKELPVETLAQKRLRAASARISKL